MLKNILILTLLALNSLAQQDLTFCDVKKIVKDPLDLPFPKWSNDLQYQVDTERNVANDKATSESREYFDGVKNWGKEIQTYAGSKFIFYADFEKDELIYITEKDSQCLVGKLKELYGMTNFYLFEFNGKEHIASALSMLIILNQQMVYIGNGETRGIPLKKWQTCIYDKNKQETLKLTVAFSNETEWYPPGVDTNVYPLFKSIPIEITVQHKKADANPYEEIITFSRFRPNLNLKSEDYQVPPGYYCRGRVNEKKLPDIPNAFSYWGQAATEDKGSFDLSGKLAVMRNEHDYEKKLYRRDYYENDNIVTEIHDSNTGLNYKINMFKENCEISPLDLNNKETQSAMEFFKFDQGEEFLYVGKRMVRDMETDVWSAPRTFMNQSSIWEWHFKSDKVDYAKSWRDPVLLLITYKYQVQPEGSILPETRTYRMFYNIYGFDQSRIDLYDFDIAFCSDNLDNKIIRFTITDEKLYPIMKVNQAAVKESIIKAVQKTAGVSLLRISRLQTVYDNNTVYVTFTLFEKPQFVGNPNAPAESSLTDAIENLKQEVNPQKILFVFNNSENTKYVARTDKDSFLELEKRDGLYQMVVRDTGKTLNWSAGSVAGFIIGFLVVGILIGFVIGIFLILKRTTLPGPLNFLNPNFTTRPAP